MTERTLPSDFIVHGVVCPRLCRMVSAPLVRWIDEAIARGERVDSELLLWSRAVDLEGRRWAACVNVSNSDASGDESSQSKHNDQLTTADVARELRCGAANVRFHVSKGHLTPVRRDPHMVFDRAELDRFKAGRT